MCDVCDGCDVGDRLVGMGWVRGFKLRLEH